MLKKLELEEMRAVCDCPAKFQTLDLLGTGLAAFFALNGLRQFQHPGEKPWAVVQIGLAGWMAWIHTKRFKYGSELGIQW